MRKSATVPFSPWYGPALASLAKLVQHVFQSCTSTLANQQPMSSLTGVQHGAGDEGPSRHLHSKAARLAAVLDEASTAGSSAEPYWCGRLMNDLYPDRRE